MNRLEALTPEPVWKYFCNSNKGGKLPMPDTDPVFGKGGMLFEYWKSVVVTR